MKLFGSILLLLFSSASADVATQTDWSGGPGIVGPVGYWECDFSCDTAMNWYGCQGELRLEATAKHPVDTSFRCCSVDIGDIDGDGNLDIVACASNGHVVAWWANPDGSGISMEKELIDGYFFGANEVELADMDLDGDVDVLGVSSIEPYSRWWENPGQLGEEWVEHSILQLTFSAVDASCADIDGNGSIDFFTGSGFSQGLVWVENVDGHGESWQVEEIDESFSGTVGVCAADLDEDGDQDVVASATGADRVSLWENSLGTGSSWVEHVIKAYFPGFSAACSDMDGNGTTDVVMSSGYVDSILWCGSTDGQIELWDEHLIDDGFAGPVCVEAGDLDGDGDSDVIAAGDVENGVSWWVNREGDGSSWSRRDIENNLETAKTVALADMNGDTHLDVIAGGCGPTSGGLYWWDLNSDFVAEASLESSLLYAGCDPDWGVVLWSAEAPPGTTIGFQVRSSDDPTSVGVWSDTLWTPASLHSLLADSTSYFQYRAILITTDPEVTPVLHEVTVTWSSLGADDGDAPSAPALLPVTPNPCAGFVSIEFGLLMAEPVELSVFDVTGRLIQTIEIAESQSGWHTMHLQPLGPGIYFVRMQAGEFTATQRFVVVE